MSPRLAPLVVLGMTTTITTGCTVDGKEPAAPPLAAASAPAPMGRLGPAEIAILCAVEEAYGARAAAYGQARKERFEAIRDAQELPDNHVEAPFASRVAAARELGYDGDVYLAARRRFDEIVLDHQLAREREGERQSRAAHERALRALRAAASDPDARTGFELALAAMASAPDGPSRPRPHPLPSADELTLLKESAPRLGIPWVEVPEPAREAADEAADEAAPDDAPDGGVAAEDVADDDAAGAPDAPDSSR